MSEQARHKHVWMLRDDGKYECDCGTVNAKDELYGVRRKREAKIEATPFSVDFAGFWMRCETEVFRKKRRVKLQLPFTIIREGEEICFSGIRTLFVLDEIWVMGLDNEGWMIVDVYYDERKKKGVER